MVNSLNVNMINTIFRSWRLLTQVLLVEKHQQRHEIS